MASDRLRDELAAAARERRDPSPDVVNHACELAIDLVTMTRPRAMTRARTECRQALARLVRSA
jgi:hypothetical protein